MFIKWLQFFKASQKVRALDLSYEKRITLAVELREKDGIFVLFAAAVKKNLL